MCTYYSFLCNKFLKTQTDFLFLFLAFFLDFVSTSSANPHETILVHLGKPCGLKGLLHMRRCNRDSYESELEFLFCLFSRIFILLMDEQNLRVGVLLSLKLCYFYALLLLNICSKLIIKLEF